MEMTLFSDLHKCHKQTCIKTIYGRFYVKFCLRGLVDNPGYLLQFCIFYTFLIGQVRINLLNIDRVTESATSVLRYSAMNFLGYGSAFTLLMDHESWSLPRLSAQQITSNFEKFY